MRVRKLLLVVLSLAGAIGASTGLVGCSSEGIDEPVASTSEALVVNQANTFGFEDRTHWTSSVALSSSTNRTQGALSMGVKAKGYVEVTSAALPSLSGVSSVLALDLLLPTQQPNPFWYGFAQLFVSVPSKGINNVQLGQFELTGRALNQFMRLDFNLPSSLTSTLAAGGYNDFRAKVVLNVPSNATGTYLLDNLRFIAGQSPGCGDLVEDDVLGRWTSGSEDAATTTLSVLGTGNVVRGQRALRATTTSGFDFWVRYNAPSPIDASQMNELRVGVRGNNTTPIGWQGNFPVIVAEDTTGGRVRFEPTAQLLSSDGISWGVASAPLAGGAGWIKTGSANLAAIRAVEIHADTWDSGFSLDVDAVSFERTGTTCECPVACGTRGTCNQQTLTCDCNLGYSGSGCTTCTAGFVMQNGACVLQNDGNATVWPNQFSKANSDPWLAVHHDQVTLVKPNLLVLLYANPGSFADETALVQQVANGLAEGSKTQGLRTPSAPAQIQYQITVRDLRDGVNGRPAAPAGWPYQNSTLFPRKFAPDGTPTTFDYAALFRPEYAQYLGYPNPSQPGQFLDLCTLINQGLVNEVWFVGSGDVPDAGALEVGGTMQNYTASGNKIPGSFTRCANGCVDTDVPFCGRTIRLGFVNYTRGPGCFLHSKGHDLESGFNNSIPGMKEWFEPLVGFNLDKKYNLPFRSTYDPSFISFPSPTQAHFERDGVSYDINPFDGVCGNVHFPPNGVENYDYFNPVQVRSSCVGFGRHAGSGGADATELIGGSAGRPWDAAFLAQYGDCGGEFLVWWYQNMPGALSGQTFGDGRKMKSVWPYLFY